MKRYLLFTYDNYYPAGGLGDLVGDFDTLEEVVNWLNNPANNLNEQFDVLDIQTGQQPEIFNRSEGRKLLYYIK